MPAKEVYRLEAEIRDALEETKDDDVIHSWLNIIRINVKAWHQREAALKTMIARDDGVDGSAVQLFDELIGECFKCLKKVRLFHADFPSGAEKEELCEELDCKTRDVSSLLDAVTEPDALIKRTVSNVLDHLPQSTTKERSLSLGSVDHLVRTFQQEEHSDQSVGQQQYAPYEGLLDRRPSATARLETHVPPTKPAPKLFDDAIPQLALRTDAPSEFNDRSATLIAKQEAHVGGRLIAPRALAAAEDPSKILDEPKKYVHRGLVHTDNIRLLELLPANEAGAQIVCRIVEAPSSRASARSQQLSFTPFEAISRYWPREEPFESILIKVKGRFEELYIPHDLDTCLRTMRRKKLGRYLWVDSICIDHDNLAESDRQMTQISQVFAHASRTCVWLGDGTATTKQAFDFIKGPLSGVLSLRSSIQDVYVSTTYIEEWLSLFEIMNRQWFHRRWPVQEIAFARNAVISCGAEEVTWELFRLAISLLDEHTVEAMASVWRHHERFSDVVDGAQIAEEILSLGALHLVRCLDQLVTRNAAGQLCPAKSLDSVLMILRALETSDPRDTIFSVLSLARDIQKTDGRHLAQTAQGTTQTYKVGYERDVVHVYREYVEHSIQTSPTDRALDVICRPFAQPISTWWYLWRTGTHYVTKYRRMEEALPSWVSSDAPLERRIVPRLLSCILRNDEGNDDILGLQRRRGDLFVSTPDRAFYRAGPAFDYSDLLPLNTYTGVLAVKGFVFDNLRTVGPPAQQGSIPSEWLPDSDIFADLHPLIRTLVADRDPHGNPGISLSQEELLRRFLLSLQSKGGQKPSFVNLLGYIRVCNPQLSSLLQHVRNTIWQRRLVTCYKHGNIGLAPLGAQEGDSVCILEGCTVPVILRREDSSDNRYTVIGESYIDGIMYGAAHQYGDPAFRRTNIEGFALV